MTEDEKMLQALTRRVLMKRSFQGALVAGMAFSLGTSGLLEVKNATVEVPGLPAIFDGYRVAFATDFHRGPRLAQSRVREVMREIRRFRPDVILMGGDYADDDMRYYREVFAELQGLSAPDGVYAVPGNHEYWDGIEKYNECIAGSAVRDITNAGVAITRGREQMWLAGIDDEWCGGPDPAAAVANAPRGAARIVVTHNPVIVDELPADYADLILAGHTHGWQVYVPVLTSLFMPAALKSSYRAGFYPSAAGLLYVSRGLGYTSVPVRLWCRPEVTLIRLRRAGGRGLSRDNGDRAREA